MATYSNPKFLKKFQFGLTIESLSEVYPVSSILKVSWCVCAFLEAHISKTTLSETCFSKPRDLCEKKEVLVSFHYRSYQQPVFPHIEFKQAWLHKRFKAQNLPETERRNSCYKFECDQLSEPSIVTYSWQWYYPGKQSQRKAVVLNLTFSLKKDRLVFQTLTVCKTFDSKIDTMLSF